MMMNVIDYDEVDDNETIKEKLSFTIKEKAVQSINPNDGLLH